VGEDRRHGEGILHRNRLSEDKFWRRYNCVLLTGNGQPPRGGRLTAA